MAEPALEGLIEALRRLPGVGVKSAQRMAFHLLQHDRDGARRLAAALTDAMQRMRHCQRCHTYTASDVCSTCLDPRRDARQLCVVETPADQAALERSGQAVRPVAVVLQQVEGHALGRLDADTGQPAQRFDQAFQRGLCHRGVLRRGTSCQAAAACRR